MTEEQFNHYKLGFKEVDAEHWALIHMMEQAKTAALQNNKREFLSLIRDLEIAIIRHFGNEEEFMSKINYPYLQAHKEQHDRLINKLKEFILSINNKQLKDFSSQQYIVTSLELIIVKHIDEQDMQIVQFLNK